MLSDAEVSRPDVEGQQNLADHRCLGSIRHIDAGLWNGESILSSRRVQEGSNTALHFLGVAPTELSSDIIG